MKHFLLILLASAASLSCCAGAPYSFDSNDYDAFKPGGDPNGFRGLRWGTNVLALAGFVKCTDNTYESRKTRRYGYTNANEKMQIGKARLKSVYYIFVSNLLVSVEIKIPYRQDFDAIRNICEKRYGIAYNRTDATRLRAHDEKERYGWCGKDSIISLVRAEFLICKWFVLSLQSVKLNGYAPQIIDNRKAAQNDL